MTFNNKNDNIARNFFQILEHEFLAGDPQTALDAPDAVALSDKMARKYFPEAYARNASSRAGIGRASRGNGSVTTTR